MRYLELLAPAKDADHGIAAINHGADAVYIGAPSFGARVAASNSLEDVERLVNYAHIFGSKVFATVNTLLFDDEIVPANKMIHQLYNMGVDAIILQDLGLLSTDLPPIELHASTQTHNYSIERIKFMESIGFKRIILAREVSLEQMALIRKAVQCQLEAFVHGALCVSFSGQCYMSQYLNNRSGNRGSCCQPCRSAYDLLDSKGNILKANAHLLSLKDFNASQHIASMIDAGITSFKIEGRLKDISYLKNVTAYYRQRLDAIMEDHSNLRPSSLGKTTLFFQPDVERTFNRGFTDYFLSLHGTREGRQKMASLSTQKSLGKQVGRLLRIEGKTLVINSKETFSPGDGLCYFNAQGQLDGFVLNQAQRIDATTSRLQPNRMPSDMPANSILWRNNDFAFEKQLHGKSAERRIGVSMLLIASPVQCTLLLTDEAGHQASSSLNQPLQEADNKERMASVWEAQLTKLGDTPFYASQPVAFEGMMPFLPASAINQLRRQAVDSMVETLRRAHLPHPSPLTPTPCTLPPQADYRANVINQASAAFYTKHGANEIEYGVEKTHDYADKALMTTKYCIRYEMGQCLRNPRTTWHDPLYLRNNKHLFLLHFDCANCQMRLLPTKPL